MVRLKSAAALALSLLVTLSSASSATASEGGLREGSSSRKLMSTRIIGGWEVPDDNNYGWMVSLQRKRKTSSNGWKHFCGGTLINKRWMLTAAHCVKYIPPDRVQLNTADITSKKAGIIRKITEVVRHPDFKTYQNDLALLKLNKDVKDVTPVVLNQYPYTSPFEEVGRLANVIGWGYEDVSSGVTVERLRETQLPIVSKTACTKTYGNKITDDHLCAGYDDTYKRDSCDGDSGGPLVMIDSSGQVSQIGVVSYGLSCAVWGYYGVYQRNSQYLDWIQETIGNDAALEVQERIIAPTPEPTAAPTDAPTVAPTDRVEDEMTDLATVGQQCKNPERFAYKTIDTVSSMKCFWACISDSACRTSFIDVAEQTCTLYKRNKCKSIDGTADHEVYDRDDIIDSLGESALACDGNQIDSFKTQSDVKCAVRCAKTNACQFAALDVSVKRCYLYSTCEFKDDEASKVWSMADFGKP